jgi:hypothetical protein
MSSPSDAEVIGRSLGAPEAFGLIYDRHAATLLRFLGRRGASESRRADRRAVPDRVRAAQDVRHVARERAPVAVRDRRESAAKAPARLRGLPLRYPDPSYTATTMLGWPR